MKQVTIYMHKCMDGKSINDMLFTPELKNDRWVFHYWLCKKVSK